MSEYTIRMEPGHLAPDQPGGVLWVTEAGLENLKGVVRGEAGGGAQAVAA